MDRRQARDAKSSDQGVGRTENMPELLTYAGPSNSLNSAAVRQDRTLERNVSPRAADRHTLQRQ